MFVFNFQSQSLLTEFVDYIKQMKVVVLEDLGAQFNIRAQVTTENLHCQYLH